MTDQGWGPSTGEYPAAPANPQVMSPMFTGALDIRWDDPRINPCNTGFQIVGVNLYRSDTSQAGPYVRINRFPIGGTFYRDVTDNILVETEQVAWETAWANRGEQANAGTWKFKTLRCPLVKRSGQAIHADSPADVVVTLNGVEIPVHEVFGPTGEITLINVPTFDAATQQIRPPAVPKGPQDVVTVSYYTNRNLVKQDLDTKLWYRLTSVATCLDENGNPLTPSGFIETPLNLSPPVTSHQIETMDYIWREAVRRNNWVLEQGGERVKVMIRKVSGVPCFHGLDPRQIEYSEHPVNRCRQCYGTGWINGYEGPYDMIIAPDDADRRVAQQPNGRRLEHTWDAWTGPSPLLTMRDFIIRQTNERYAIGPVRKPSNRGNVMQQHFQIEYIDEQDIRYEVPLPDPASLNWPECRIEPPTLTGGAWKSFNQFGPYPEGEQETIPMTTEKENIPDEREQRGRTSVWSNTTY